MRRIALVVVCVWAASAVMPSAQQPALRSATTTIPFDVVVRDGKGLPVRDMAATEFELSEDGSRQTIAAIFGPGGRALDASAARVTPPEGVTPSAAAVTRAPAVSPGTDAEASPSVVAFVFDQLTPEARAMAAGVADAMLAGMPTRD